MHLDSNKQAIRLLTFFAVATVMSIGACAIQAQTYTFQPSENPLQQAVEISIAVAGKVKMKSARFGVIEEDVQVAGKQSYEQWMKFTVPLYLALVTLGCVSIAVAIAIGLQ